MSFINARAITLDKENKTHRGMEHSIYNVNKKYHDRIKAKHICYIKYM